MTDSEAIDILERQKSIIETLKHRVPGSQEFKKWWWNTDVAIRKVFGDQSRRVRSFSKIPYRPSFVNRSTSDAALYNIYLRGLESADALLTSMIDEIKHYGLMEEALPEAPQYEYISQARLTELRAIRSADFGLQRLIRLCEEIDICFQNGCWFAVAALTRALIDHVPPIFGQNTFSEVANNYSGTKSFKDSMRHLQGSSRSIADAYLHTQIRRQENLPMATQVNFAPDLDVLLEEIVRKLR